MRKAFGAPTRTLVAQFVVENVILTLLGGAIGLVLSALVLRALNQSGFIAHSAFTINARVFVYGRAAGDRLRRLLRRLSGLAHVAPPPGRGPQGRTVAMIRHLVRLIWNRKRPNLLLTIEILCAFLVVFVVAARSGSPSRSTRARRSASTPSACGRSTSAGRARCRPGRRGGRGRRGARERDAFTRLLAAVRELPQVEIAAGAFTAPYVNASWGSGADAGRRPPGRLPSTTASTDDFMPLLSMPIVAGRWFSREDDGADRRAGADQRPGWRATIFGDANPIGQIIPERRPTAGKPRSAAQAEARRRRDRGLPPARRATRRRRPCCSIALPARRRRRAACRERLLIRVRPGTTAAFEAVLVRRLQREAPDWSFERVDRWSTCASASCSDYLMPLARAVGASPASCC